MQNNFTIFFLYKLIYKAYSFMDEYDFVKVEGF